MHYLHNEQRSLYLRGILSFMGVTERKEREKTEMRELITAAAMKMFLEDGYAKTSIRGIADAIEYSPGTIYLYFKDKDELLYEVQADAYGRLFEVFKKEATSTDPLQKLNQLARAYINFGLNNPELYDLMFIIRAPMNVDEELHKVNGANCLNFLVDCLTDCINKDLLRMNDVQQATLQIWSTVHGLVSLNLRCRLKIMVQSEEAVPQVLIKTMEDYLAAVTK
jgi:AcrR family transcriptional regulator